MRRKLTKRFLQFLSLILVLTLLCPFVFTYASVNNFLTQNDMDINMTSKIFQGDGYVVDFILLNSWENGSNFQMELKNVGNKTIENWSLLIEFKNEIVNIWNAQIIDHKEDKYVIKNAGWNQNIEVGQSISFGMSISSSFTNVPDSISLIFNNRIDNTEDVVIDYIINNNWGNGCTGIVSITNQSNTSIENWSIEFDSTFSDIVFWEASVLSINDNHYVIHNVGYNSVINPQTTINIGFLINGVVGNELFSNFILSKDGNNQIENYWNTDDSSDLIYEKEPLNDIGDNYYKHPVLSDIVFDEESKLEYVKNQLLISAYMGTPNEAIVEIVNEIGAEIVGYTAITCDYQIEFFEDKTISDLKLLIEYLEGFPCISRVFLNTAMRIVFDSKSNDELYNDGFNCVKKWVDSDGDGDFNDDGDYHFVTLEKITEGIESGEWDESDPSGDNWGLEVLQIPSAWDKVTDSHTVKVGIIDGYFVDIKSSHGKEELIFDDILRNVKFDSQKHSLSHGNHVAGIIGATHNNYYGISGVATDVKLYGYTMSEDKNELSSEEGIDVNCIAGDMVALNTLICNHVKVINMSFGYADKALVYGASHGNVDAQNRINEDADIAVEHLRKLTDVGYDFLIVKSAGNYNDVEFIKDEHDKYGYHIYKEGVDDKTKIEKNGVEAEYGYYINAISDDDLRNRIIVVGAFNQYNNISSFSGRNLKLSRVDVIAPGENILSTVPVDLDLSAAEEFDPLPGFKIMSGTSMATPYISGIAALMYQVKPSLSAKRVKEFICYDPNIVRKIDGYKVPSAQKCVDYVKNIYDTTAFDVNWPTGIIAGSVRNKSGEMIFDATIHIQAIRHSTGEYNLEQNVFNIEVEKTNLLNGDFIYPLPQGVYDILVYTEASKTKYLPTIIKDLEINPDETTYLQSIKLSSWKPSSLDKITGTVIN